MPLATREELMVRIFEVLGTVPGIISNARNRGLLATESRPAQVLLDGDERSILTLGGRRGRAGVMAPQIMAAQPQIFYLPKEKRPATNNPLNIGTEANDWLLVVQQKIWSDATLAGMLTSNGSLAYNGCETDMKSGSAMSGEIRLDFTMNYVLDPTS